MVIKNTNCADQQHLYLTLLWSCVLGAIGCHETAVLPLEGGNDEGMTVANMHLTEIKIWFESAAQFASPLRTRIKD